MKKEICILGLGALVLFNGCAKTPDANGNFAVNETQNEEIKDTELYEENNVEWNIENSGEQFHLQAVLPENLKNVKLYNIQMKLEENSMSADEIWDMLVGEDIGYGDVTEQTNKEIENQMKSEDTLEQTNNNQMVQNGVIPYTYLQSNDGEVMISWNNQDLTLTDEKLLKRIKNAEGSINGEMDTAENVLKEKLAQLGLNDISIIKEENGGAEGQEIQFVPVVHQLPIAYEGITDINSPRIYGQINIVDGQIAQLYLLNGFLKEETSEEQSSIITVEKLHNIMTQAIKDKRINICSEIVYTHLSLEYYPMLENGNIVLLPAWHIYLTSEEKEQISDEVWSEMQSNGIVPFNIYINAVTGDFL